MTRKGLIYRKTKQPTNQHTYFSFFKVSCYNTFNAIFWKLPEITKLKSIFIGHFYFSCGWVRIKIKSISCPWNAHQISHKMLLENWWNAIQGKYSKIISSLQHILIHNLPSFEKDWDNMIEKFLRKSLTGVDRKNRC